MSDVVWVDNQHVSFDNTVAHKIRRLADAAGGDPFAVRGHAGGLEGKHVRGGV